MARRTHRHLGSEQRAISLCHRQPTSASAPSPSTSIGVEGRQGVELRLWRGARIGTRPLGCATIFDVTRIFVAVLLPALLPARTFSISSVVTAISYPAGVAPPELHRTTNLRDVDVRLRH